MLPSITSTLFEMEREIRSQIPIIWLNIWDDYPAPRYNENFPQDFYKLKTLETRVNLARL